MSDAKGEKVALVKMPSFARLLMGGIAAYWLSTIMNPAFVAIAVLVILLIPILTVDNIFSNQFSSAYRQPVQVVPKVMSRSEYLESKAALENKEVETPERENFLNEGKKKPTKAKSKR